jgi:hypothetical protein
MLRGLVTLLVMAIAAVPPGFCQCRLEAALFASAHETSHDLPGHEEEDDDCGCRQLKEDCLAPPAPELPTAGTDDVAIAAAKALSAASRTTSFDSVPAPRVSAPPIYLALRALRI